MFSFLFIVHNLCFLGFFLMKSLIFCVNIWVLVVNGSFIRLDFLMLMWVLFGLLRYVIVFVFRLIGFLML